MEAVPIRIAATATAFPRLMPFYLLTVWFAVGSVFAADDPIESAKGSLSRGLNPPWYDEDRDGLRRMDVQPRPAPSRDQFEGEWDIEPPDWQFDWLPDLSWLSGMNLGRGMQIILWILLGVLLLAVVAILVWAFLVFESRFHGSLFAHTVEEDNVSDAERIEALPFQVRKPNVDLLAEAQQHYEAGEYGEAVIYLFSYQLVRLDRSQVIRISKGKTNRQYLREMQRGSYFRLLLEQTMIAFENVFFGHHPLGKEQFEACWNQLDEFHQHLERAS